jgi:hypothetical protein
MAKESSKRRSKIMEKEWISIKEAHKEFGVNIRTLQSLIKRKIIEGKYTEKPSGGGTRIIWVLKKSSLIEYVESVALKAKARTSIHIKAPTRQIDHKQALRRTEAAIRAYCSALEYPIDEKLLQIVLKAEATKIHPVVEAFKRKREKYYISNAMASKLTGVGISTLSELQTGKFHPSAKTIEKLEAFLSGAIDFPTDDASMRVRKRQWVNAGVKV